MIGKRFVVVGSALVMTAMAAAGLATSAASGRKPNRVLGPGEATIELRIDHSRFSASRFLVRSGTDLTFVITNRDPIAHEFIVGPDQVHARHANGGEAFHPPVPGEVSVGAGETASTTFGFDTAGTFEFACHLPGHFNYGMRGEVVVIDG